VNPPVVVFVMRGTINAEPPGAALNVIHMAGACVKRVEAVKVTVLDTAAPDATAVPARATDFVEVANGTGRAVPDVT
jgi:hypothetical protein